ncbi:hypothetical protein HDU98_005463 [Podochytrium sp. JEL0797]|nr:hypothetical protein HDU98_005463 [Podochytrium sp. JEL0797]
MTLTKKPDLLINVPFPSAPSHDKYAVTSEISTAAAAAAHSLPRLLFVVVDESSALETLHWTLKHIVKSATNDSIVSQDALTMILLIDNESDRETTLERTQNLVIENIKESTHHPTSFTIRTLVCPTPQQTGPLLCHLVSESKPHVLVLGDAESSSSMLLGISNYCMCHAACAVVMADAGRQRMMYFDGEYRKKRDSSVTLACVNFDSSDQFPMFSM